MRQVGVAGALASLVIGLAVAAVSSAASTDVARIVLTGTGDGVVKFDAVTDPPFRGSCSSSCSFPYPLAGLSVTLTATPASGSRFAGWVGRCASAGTNRSCSITGVAGVNEVAARFDLVPRPKTTTTTAAPTTKPKPTTSAPKAPAAGPPPAWQVMHLAFGIRCDIGPCHIAGDVVIRVKGVQLPPRTKPKTRADFSGPTWLQLLERHEPRDIRLAVAGRTILYPPQWIVRSHEAEPHVEFSAYAEPNIRSGPLLQPGSLPGVLTFATNAGKVRIPVTVRITRRA